MNFTSPQRYETCTHPLFQWDLRALSMGVNLPGPEADHSPPSGAEVKEVVELYSHSPNTPSWCGAQLKHRDKFTLFVLIFYILGQRKTKDSELNGSKHFPNSICSYSPCERS
jgi:hypothetical protein